MGHLFYHRNKAFAELFEITSLFFLLYSWLVPSHFCFVVLERLQCLTLAHLSMSSFIHDFCSHFFSLFRVSVTKKVTTSELNTVDCMYRARQMYIFASCLIVGKHMFPRLNSMTELCKFRLSNKMLPIIKSISHYAQDMRALFDDGKRLYFSHWLK